MPAKKPFPLIDFETALSFARNIQSSGAEGTIKRLTLLDLTGMRPGSSKTRSLITHSATYGLTKGSYAAEFISLTEDGRLAIAGPVTGPQRKRHFQLAISRIAPFDGVFKRFKGKGVPNPAVIRDELEAFGVAPADTARAMDTLLSNLRFLGAIRNVAGADHIVEPEYDEVTAGAGHADAGDAVGDRKDDGDAEETRLRGQAMPSLHIDVQVHIDSSATAEQIDQIFKSMATHLYSGKA